MTNQKFVSNFMRQYKVAMRNLLPINTNQYREIIFSSYYEQCYTWYSYIIELARKEKRKSIIRALFWQVRDINILQDLAKLCT